MDAISDCRLPAIPYLHIFPQGAIATAWHIAQDTIEE